MASEQRQNRLTVGDGIRFGIGFIMAPFFLYLLIAIFGTVVIPTLRTTLSDAAGSSAPTEQPHPR